METSIDSITGTNQNKKDFWRKVVKKYEEIRAANPKMPYRTPFSIRGRYGRLASTIAVWIGC